MTPCTATPSRAARTATAAIRIRAGLHRQRAADDGPGVPGRRQDARGGQVIRYSPLRVFNSRTTSRKRGASMRNTSRFATKQGTVTVTPEAVTIPVSRWLPMVPRTLRPRCPRGARRRPGAVRRRQAGRGRRANRRGRAARPGADAGDARDRHHGRGRVRVHAEAEGREAARGCRRSVLRTRLRGSLGWAECRRRVGNRPRAPRLVRRRGLPFQ